MKRSAIVIVAAALSWGVVANYCRIKVNLGLSTTHCSEVAKWR